MIERNDRGFVIAKSLAWTILSALILGSIWVGLQVGRLDEIVRRLEQHDARIAGVERRAGAAEQTIVRSEARQEEILRLLVRVDSRLERLEASADRP